MSSRIEELNLTIPDAVDIEEQQRVLIENFSLIRDLLVTPAYLHAHRHKETSDSLSTTYLQVSSFDAKSVNRKHVDIDISTGALTLDIDGVYVFDLFIHMEGSASNDYKVALRDGTSALEEYTFDAHDPGGHVYLHHAFMYEFSDTDIQSGLDLNFAVGLVTGSASVIVAHFHVQITRVDNYNIP